MRSPTICLIALAVAVILLSQPVSALTVMQVPYFRAGPVWHLNPSQITDLVIIEMNTSHLAASDDEAFAMSFSPVGDGVPGGLAISPTIAQTSSQTIVATDSYFFQDFNVGI